MVSEVISGMESAMVSEVISGMEAVMDGWSVTQWHFGPSRPRQATLSRNEYMEMSQKEKRRCEEVPEGITGRSR